MQCLEPGGLCPEAGRPSRNLEPLRRAVRLLLLPSSRLPGCCMYKRLRWSSRADLCHPPDVFGCRDGIASYPFHPVARMMHLQGMMLPRGFGNRQVVTKHAAGAVEDGAPSGLPKSPVRCFLQDRRRDDRCNDELEDRTTVLDVSTSCPSTRTRRMR